MLYTLIICLCAYLVSDGTPVSVQDVLDHWEAGADLIDSYDVTQRLTPTSFTIVENGGIRIAPPGKGVTLMTRRARVYKSGKSRRGEFGSTDDPAEPTMTLVYDGNTIYSWDKATPAVTIQKSLITFGGIEYEDYETLYRTVSGLVDRIKLTRARNSHLLAKEGHLFVLESPPEKKGDRDYRDTGWRVWHDPDRNFLPVKIFQWHDKGSGQVADREIVVDLG